MGTPEDVAAEKYFTPPTLTEMLEKDMLDFTSLEIRGIKGIFKEWLRTVGIGYGGRTPEGAIIRDIIEGTRRTLIALVDEP